MAGKLDSRQKMINMMYLVFIAMLALNIGKEVLATLGVLNDDLESSITELEVSSTASYSQIETNSEKLDYKIAASKVVEMKAEADNFFNYIQVIKDSLLIGENGENKYLKQIQNKETGEEITRMAYQEMDKSQVLDDYFFEGEFLTANGEQYVSNYKSFPTKLSQILDDIVFLEEESKIARTALDGSKGEDGVEIQYDFESAKFDLKNRFSYSDQIVNSEGTTQGFLEYNFYGFPVIASLAKLTKVQSDIRYIENKILNEILSSIQGKGLNFSTFQTLLETTKPVYYTTDVVDAAIVMGKKDEGFKPDKVELFINGRALRPSEFKIQSGKVVLNTRFSSPGSYELTGTITKRNADTQELVSIPVNQSIVVIKEPNSAVVSADNMKVFYRGLRNPSSISIPGVAESSIRPTSNNGEFIRLSTGGWGAVPTSDFSKKTMKVSVSGILNGERKIFDGGEFRILEPPPGIGSIKVNDNYFKPTENIPKRYLANGMITGNKPADFLYDFVIEVTSFDIKVGNSPSKTVKGNSARNNPKAVADINSQGRGTVVRISNIKASAKDGDFVNPNYIVNDFIVILE
jgi:gliding motility-associated protein GldM